jgi:hypothetical protein
MSRLVIAASATVTSQVIPRSTGRYAVWTGRGAQTTSPAAASQCAVQYGHETSAPSMRDRRCAHARNALKMRDDAMVVDAVPTAIA